VTAPERRDQDGWVRPRDGLAVVAATVIGAATGGSNPSRPSSACGSQAVGFVPGWAVGGTVTVATATDRSEARATRADRCVSVKFDPVKLDRRPPGRACGDRRSSWHWPSESRSPSRGRRLHGAPPAPQAVVEATCPPPDAGGGRSRLDRGHGRRHRP
jgi:hypothetical protein